MCYLKCSIFILLVIRTFFAGEASGSKYIQSRAIEKRKSGCTEKQKVKPRRKKEDKFISLAKQKKRRQKLIEKHRLLKAKFQKMLQRGTNISVTLLLHITSTFDLRTIAIGQWAYEKYERLV